MVGVWREKETGDEGNGVEEETGIVKKEGEYSCEH